jgi:hypothetical protein
MAGWFLCFYTLCKIQRKEKGILYKWVWDGQPLIIEYYYPDAKQFFCFFFLLIIKLWVMCNWIQTNMHILTNSCIEDFLFQESWFCVHYLLRLHNATRFFFYFYFFLFSSIPCQERTYDSPQNNKKILPVAKRFNFSTITQLQCGNQKGFFCCWFQVRKRWQQQM